MRAADADLVAVLAAAREGGSPVAGWSESEREEIARTAARRWRSYSRRHPKPGSFDEQVEDLARGLARTLEPHMKPLMADYRWLARQLGDVLRHSG